VSEPEARAVFAAADVESITNNVQVSATGPLTSLEIAQVGTSALAGMRVIPGAVGTVAFGTFRALDFTIRPSGHIPLIASRTGTLTSTGSMAVAFDLWLPSGTRPAKGWPVAICSHGSFITKNFCFSTAAVLASHGIAVISINAMGHGNGPRTTMTVGLAGGRSLTFSAPGNGYDADGNGAIDPWEPQRVARPLALLNTVGSLVQTTALHLQLVRGIQDGVDVDGDGTPDLDGARIYYFGHSLGSVHGMVTFAIEPAIRAAVFVVPAGTLIYNTMLSPSIRPGFGTTLALRSPPLLNPEQGISSLDGWDVAEPRFNENLPLRDRPPLVNTVAGALAIQRVADHMAWAAQIASTSAFAPLLRRMPLAGVPVRPFIIQAARSDSSSANPMTSELIRAGDVADRVAFYRHDLNFGKPGVPPTSHTFLPSVGAPPDYSRVAFGAQQQIAAFFESDGKSVIHPAPTELWEMPITKPLPEDLFLMRRPR
jgi:hypothetical protein